MHCPDLFYWRPVSRVSDAPAIDADLVVYGATSAGVSAAVQAARMGLRVALAAFGRHVGGLTAGGLGETDTGRSEAIGGIAREFYRRIGALGGDRGVIRFTPSAATAVFHDLLREHGVTVRYEQHLEQVVRDGARIVELRMTDGSRWRGGVYLDATYEGDLLAKADVSCRVGREDNTEYDETVNGVYLSNNHTFPVAVDPWRTPGDPASGLLWGIDPAPLGPIGAGDQRVQAYNFRMCLTDDPARRMPIFRPADYDPARYELLRRLIAGGIFDCIALNSPLPDNKTDVNNEGGFSSDYIGASDGWPEGTFEQREAIFQDHVSYTAGLWWFLQNDPDLPDAVRDEAAPWGLPRDEYADSGHWTPWLYIREARRMVGRLVHTEHDCIGGRTVEDSIGMASYGIDSHNCRRLVAGGRVLNEGNVQVKVRFPWRISYRAITPRREQCANLLVPVCASATHVAYSSLRMEPVFMILGQSAATAAALAIRHGCDVQDVPFPELRQRLLADGQVLEAARRLWIPRYKGR